MSGDPAGLPPELRAFIHACIESIDQVELLVVLRGSERFRSAGDVASEFGIAAASARRNLETLAARGLLEVRVGGETTFRFRPRTDELRRYCDLLAGHYVTSRSALMGFVATESRLAVKRFADAFKLRDSERDSE